jgi:DNA polymerase I
MARQAQPNEERTKAKREEIVGKVYKRYAVNPETAEIRLVSVATHGGLNEAIDATQIDVSPLLEALRHKTFITHNGSFDLGVLRERYGYVHEGRILDTELLDLLHHYAEDGERTESSGGKLRLPDPTKTKVELDGKKVGMTALKVVVKKHLGVELDKDKQSEDWSTPELPPEMVAYALEDSRVLLDLSKVLIGKLEAIGEGDIVEIESRTLPAVIYMEGNGFPADPDVAEEMAARYAAEAKAALEKLTALLPQPKAPDEDEWRWTKKAHILAALRLLRADVDRDDYPKTANTGEPSTSKAALGKITGPGPAVEWVEAYLEYSELSKRSRDFVSRYRALIRDGGIRGFFVKTVSTGRLGCRRPNLQQVPKRGELQTKDGMRIRDIFRPPAGRIFVVADFEQVELLLAATIAEKTTGMKGAMLDVFRRGEDIHRETAAWVLDKPKKDVSDAERTLAKCINFGLIYGCSAERLQESATTGYKVPLDLEQAERYREAFFEKYPELAEWHRKVGRECNIGYEYAVTPLGRKRKLPVWESSGKIAHTVAKNHPVQGAGADAIKLTLAKLFEDRHNCPGNPELNCCVHDEVVLSVDQEHEEEAKIWVAGHMADAEREAIGDPNSPIHVDVKVMRTWGGGD